MWFGLRGGGLNISGSGNFTEDNFSTTGKLMLRGVNYEAQGFALRDASRGR